MYVNRTRAAQLPRHAASFLEEFCVDFTGPADDVGLGIVVEVALGEG